MQQGEIRTKWRLKMLYGERDGVGECSKARVVSTDEGSRRWGLQIHHQALDQTTGGNADCVSALTYRCSPLLCLSEHYMPSLTHNQAPSTPTHNDKHRHTQTSESHKITFRYTWTNMPVHTHCSVSHAVCHTGGAVSELATDGYRSIGLAVSWPAVLWCLEKSKWTQSSSALPRQYQVLGM